MDEESSQDIQLIRSYDEDEIGSRLTTNFILIKNDLTIKQAMSSLIEQAGDNDNISTIYVEDADERFYGAIALNDLIRARVQDKLETLISTSYPYVTDHEKIADCLERIREYTEDSFPVLSEDGKVLGYASLSPYRDFDAYLQTVELSVYVAPESRGRGIASALMEAVLRLAREDAGTHTVVSVIAGGNAASVRLHEKFGFTYSGTLHEVGLKFGRYLDIVNYELRVG